MEHVDFTRPAVDAREHALYAAHMLQDIRAAAMSSQRDPSVIAVVNRLREGLGSRRAESKKADAQAYGLAALEQSEVRIVHWDDAESRERFLAERISVAGGASG